MNIIIPLGGKGERFTKHGYNTPKPLIKIFEKCMIDYVLDNLFISKNDKMFIIYNKNLNDYNFKQYINSKFSFINLIEIGETKGASETLLLGIQDILNNYEYNTKTIILDFDTFYTENILHIFNEFDDKYIKPMLMNINDYFYNSSTLTDKQKDYLNFIIMRHLSKISPSV